MKKKLLPLFVFSLLLTQAFTQSNIPVSFPTDYITQFQDVFVDENGDGFAVGICGVLRKTSDFGQSWETAAAPTSDNMETVACAPGDCSRALIAGSEGLFLLDGGDWKDVTYDGYQEGEELHWLTDQLVIYETQGMQYMRSTNGGNTWSPVELTDWQWANMSVIDENAGYLFVKDTLYRTENNWSEVSNTGYVHTANVMAMTWLNADQGWLFDGDRLFYNTTDGGKSWNLLNTESQLTSVNWMVTLSETHLVGAQVTTSRLESTDGGVTWSRTSFLTEGNERVNEKYHQLGDAFYLVGNQNQLLYSEKDFKDFEELDPFGRVDRFDAIAFANNDRGYAMARHLLFKTNDAGLSWVRDTLPTFGRDMTVLNDGSVVFLTGGTSYISTDQGDNFDQWIPDELIPQNEGPSIIGRQANGDLYLMSQNYAYISSDDGISFDTVNTGHGYTPSAIFFLDENIGYATGGQSQFMRTIDGGQNWTMGSGPSNNIVAVYFTDEQNGWASQASARYVTTDGGVTWSYEGGKGGYDLTIHPDGSFLSPRFGSGNTGELGRSSDNGLTWNTIARNCFSYRSGGMTPDGKYFFTGGDGFIVRHDIESLTTGTKNIPGREVRALNIFPNPTSGLTTLEIPATNKESFIKVFNTNGQLVHEQSIAPGEQLAELSLTPLLQGLYVVQWMGTSEMGQSLLVKSE